MCVVDFCTAAQFYIVPRTGVFTTCTGLNTGLQRGHPTAIPPWRSVLLHSLVTCSVSLGQNENLIATDKMFPAPKGRNGQHYQRQHLSGVQLTFRQQLAAEFASRNCAYTAAVPATDKCVCVCVCVCGPVLRGVFRCAAAQQRFVCVVDFCAAARSVPCSGTVS